MHPAYMLLAIPAFFLCIGIEWLYGYIKKQNYYRLNDTVTNLAIGTGQQVFGLIFKAMLLGVYIWVADNYALFHIPATWWSWVLCMILFDFLFYWAHRWGHEINLFWGAHVVHHQSEEFNLSVALRQSWFHNLIAFPLFLPIPLMGFDKTTFFTVAIFHTLSQFWIHTKAIGKLHPWIEFWFNTPSHHRVHHAIDPKYIDKNHAGLLMIWDRLFGTFKEEENSEAIHYGITTQFTSWNPAWANVHYYAEMWQKAQQMKWIDKLRMIFARPGWLPEYLGGYQAPKEVNDTAYRKFDANTNVYMRIYASLQFILLLLGAVQFMRYYPTISLFYKTVFFALLFITMLIIGALFENKRWVMYAEYFRLVLVMLSLNTFYYFWYINWFNVMMIASAVLFVSFAVFYTYSILRLLSRNVNAV